MDDFRVTMDRKGSRSFNDYSRGPSYIPNEPYLYHDDRTVRSYNDDGGYGGRGRGRGGRGRGRGGGGYRGSNPYKFQRNKGYRDKGRQEGLDSLRHYSPRGSRSWRGRGGGGRGRNDAGPTPRSRLEEDEDGDFEMGGGASSNFSRRTPYDRPQSRRFDQGPDRDRMKRLGVPMGSGDSYTQMEQWFRVIIPFGKNATKDWILQSINNVCELPFKPVMFSFEGKRAQFFIQGKEEARAVKNCSRKITMPNGFKMVIETAPAKRPFIGDNLDDETVEKLKVVMSGRYDPALKALDLSDFYHDKDLNREGIHLPLSRINAMTKVLEIIAEHIPELETLNINSNRLFSLENLSELGNKAPNIKSVSLKNNEVKSDRDLDVLKKLPIEELHLEGNPLCDRFDDERSYVSAMRKRFPKLVKLDGHTLPPPIKFELESETPLPQSKGSHFSNDQVKDLVCLFLKQYYELYDGDKRDSLMDAYHETAMFSYSWFYNDLAKYGKSFNSYQESRNLMKVYDNYKRQKGLKSGKLNIVAYLTQLPKTQHDPSSLVIDVTHTSDRLLSFTVNGVFKETDARGEPPLRAFNRSFVTVPQGQGIVIINEELTITNPTQEQVKKSFRNPAPTPSSSPVLGHGSSSDNGATVAASTQQAGAMGGLTDIQQQMVTSFSSQSGMNSEWSAKCLAQNDWNYDKAGQVFIELNGKGSIPPEAFTK